MSEENNRNMHHVTLHKPKKPWYKRFWVWAGVFAALCVLAAIGNSGSNTPTTNASSNSNNTSTSSNKPASTASTPKIGQGADDGKLGFTVTSFKCGIPEIDQPGDTDGIDSTTSGAPYCEMNLSVKGVSNVAQDFDDDSQYVYASGKQYSVDDDATIDANNVNSNCMEDPTINPGTSVTCVLVFDVPKAVTPTYAMLHDSAASDGVKVSLVQ
jgi:hypothetical protein